MYSNQASSSNSSMIAALLLSPLHSTPSLCQPASKARDTSACIPGTPFCFPQALDPGTGISMALILPPEPDTPSSGFLPRDFIASISTPLPYGFAGVGGADEGDEGEVAARSATTFAGMSAEWWIQAVEGVLPRSHHVRSDSEGYHTPLVQIYEKSLTADALTRVENPIDAGAHITLSPRSSQSATASHMLFRCQNCPVQPILDHPSPSTPGTSTPWPSIKLATSISSTQPVYPSAMGNSSSATGVFSGSAVLPLTGIKRGTIVVAPFVTGEYEAIARILQLD